MCGMLGALFSSSELNFVWYFFAISFLLRISFSFHLVPSSVYPSCRRGGNVILLSPPHLTHAFRLPALLSPPPLFANAWLLSLSLSPCCLPPFASDTLNAMSASPPTATEYDDNDNDAVTAAATITITITITIITVVIFYTTIPTPPPRQQQQQPTPPPAKNNKKIIKIGPRARSMAHAAAPSAACVVSAPDAATRRLRRDAVHALQRSTKTTALRLLGHIRGYHPRPSPVNGGIGCCVFAVPGEGG